MSESFIQPKKIGVWAEGTRIEAKEYVLPKKESDSSDDIPTIPDIDDFQDILEKEIAKPPNTGRTDAETVNTLAEVSENFTTTEGMEAALEKLKSFIPEVQLDDTDTVWTVDTLLAQLVEETEAT